MGYVRRPKQFVAIAQPPRDPVPFTQGAITNMRAELFELKRERVQILDRLKTAREQGDLSENGAYTSAKFELGRVGRRIGELHDLLELAFVPQETHANDLIIRFGSKIEVEVTKTKERKVFQLVSQFESSPVDGKLSMESPIGQALLGKKPNELVVVVSPSGEQEYLIISVNE